MSNLVKHAPWKLEAVDAEKARVDELTAGDFIKLKQGKNVLRILPPVPGATSPFVIAQRHFLKLPGQESAKNFACPRHHARRRCPACAQADTLKATGNSADFQLAKDLQARLNVFAVAIDRAHPELGPKIWQFGKTIYERLVEIRQDPAWGDFTDPGPDGFDIEVFRKGEKLNTEYSVQGARDYSALSSDAAEVETWLSDRPNIAGMDKPPSDQDLLTMLGGAGMVAATVDSRGPRRTTPRTADADMVDKD